MCFIILPSLLFTASLIICGSSRPEQRRIEEIRNGRKNASSGTFSKSEKSGRNKSQIKISSAGSIQSFKKQKMQKLSDSKSKTKKSGKSMELYVQSPSSKSSEKISSVPKRSSRFERFKKSQTYTNRSIAYNINEKLKEELEIEPRLLNWNILGGMQKVYLSNPSNERRAIKVKCSDNQLYRVSHVFAFVEPGEKLGIDIIRQNGSAKPDKMIFLWTLAEKGDENASKLFNRVSSYPMVTLPLTVNNPIE